MSSIEAFSDNQLKQISSVLADTSTGLTNSQISQLLRSSCIDDIAPGITKKERLYEALYSKQKQDRCGNNVVAFIQRAMDPIRYSGQSEAFKTKMDELNEVLVFCGYMLGEDGKLRKAHPVKTLTEAETRVSRIKQELNRRNVHHDVLKFCKVELLDKNYFHAVFEATKSVADKIRSKTGLSEDGSKLVDQAFGIGDKNLPLLAFNTLGSETDRSEHTGLMNLMKGMFGVFRNTTAHYPKISWSISEQDALDLMTIASFLHRRLDSSIRTPRRL